MKISPVGILGLAALAFIAVKSVFQKGEAVKNLNVNISKIDFNKKSNTFVVFVRVLNPSNAPITISSIVGDVFWKGSAGATLNYMTPVTIKSLEERTIQIPVELNLDLATIIFEFFTKKIKEALTGKFEVRGSVNAEGLVFPFEYSKEIKLI